MRSIYTYDIQLISVFVNTYNMCVCRLWECCGKNPSLAGCYSNTSVCVCILLPAVFRRIILRAASRKHPCGKIGLYRV